MHEDEVAAMVEARELLVVSCERVEDDQPILSFADVGADEATSCADGVVFEGVGIKAWETCERR